MESIGVTHRDPTAKMALSLSFFSFGMWRPQIAKIGMIRIMRSVTTLMTLAQTSIAYSSRQFSPFAILAPLPTHSVATVKTRARA